MKNTPKKPKNRQKIQIDLQRFFKENETVLGISIGFVVAALIIMTHNAFTPPKLHAAPTNIQIEKPNIDRQYHQPEKKGKYTAPDRAITNAETTNNQHIKL